MTEKKKRGRPPKKDTPPKKTPPKKTPPKKDPTPARPGYVANPQHPLDVTWGRDPNLVKVRNGTGDNPGLYVAKQSVDVAEFNISPWKWETPCISGFGIYVPVTTNGVTVSSNKICESVRNKKKHGILH